MKPQSAQLAALLEAIRDDDRTLTRKLTKTNPDLATTLIAKPKLYKSPVAHWIYVSDTPLHLAAAAHYPEIAMILLTAGADPNAARNHRHSTPLHYAADGYLLNPHFEPSRQVKTLRQLLDAGADLLAADKNGATALHRAVRTRCAAAVEFLLLRGANPTAFNKPGSSPFHLAVQNTGRGGSGDPRAKQAQIRIIQLMLTRGVSPDTPDIHGRTVREWTRSKDLLQLLA